MFPVRYEVPTVEIRDSAATEEIFWAGVIALSAIAVIGTLGAICELQGGNLSWGISWGGPFGLVPQGIWYVCNFR
ncbi:MAG: hypothetical protein ABSD56_12975 [Bryobacteraceae bacterium]